MDHTNTLSHPRDRHPRAPSRASTSTTSTRQTMHTHSTANTSLASPKLPPSSLSLPHRPYTTTGTKPPPALDTQSPVSTFLHERLQRERRADHDRPPPSPRGSPARPPSSGSADSRRRGMGAKEMEQTVSTLHKQNFDLKLELYHRRERQTGLESRLEDLRREKGQVEEMNDTLVAELEKRDKAVEEAVAMIVLLESRVETLLREREMVRSVEQGSAFRRLQYEDLEREAMQTPRPRAPSGGSADASTRAVHRVPSFLSVRSDTTENLRSVYLGTHGSLHSLRRPEEERVASPCLSVLSESSFLSVYGRGGDDARPSIDESLSEMRMAQTGAQPRLAQLDRQPRSNSLTASAQRPSRAAPAAGSNTEYSSPLQRLERTYSLKTSSSGPETPAQQPDPSPSHRRTKEQKREALRRVLTDAPRRDVALPPTPDTISTTTLRRCKNSDDTLGAPQGARLDLPPLLQPAPAPSQPTQKPQDPPMTAFGSRQDAHAPFFNIAPRPRSAGETTVSRHGWDSDSDSDSDAASDIWMQEGAKPRADSPDLFGFPATWGGSRDMDELISVQAGLLPPGPPPPPNRRSSLQAPTGGRRHARRNSDGVAEGQYPPAAKPRGLGRLNPFRRSLGGEPPATADTNPGAGKSAMGVPSRIRNDDEGARATPPPILRNRGASVTLGDDDGGVALGAQDAATPRVGEGRRKWLGGFGRRDARRVG